jgi:hypothetical protein
VSSNNTSNTVSKLGPSDYRGNQSAGFNPNITPTYAAGTTDATNTTDGGNPPQPLLGIFDNGTTYMNSSVGIADVSDGTSNTILMGESLTGTWAEASSCCVRTTTDRTINKPIAINGVNYYTYWMSKHPGIVNFLKCDGSVSTVTNTVKRDVLVKQMTRAGGEALSSDQIK